jgi:hypothetical protein
MFLICRVAVDGRPKMTSEHDPVWHRVVIPSGVEITPAPPPPACRASGRDHQDRRERLLAT